MSQIIHATPDAAGKFVASVKEALQKAGYEIGGVTVVTERRPTGEGRYNRAVINTQVYVPINASSQIFERRLVRVIMGLRTQKPDLPRVKFIFVSRRRHIPAPN